MANVRRAASIIKTAFQLMKLSLHASGTVGSVGITASRTFTAAAASTRRIVRSEIGWS
jgi:hypothetical protein